jgi:GT2 family glycosyltransferase
VNERPVCVVIPSHREHVDRIVATVRSAIRVVGVDLVVLVDDSGIHRAELESFNGYHEGVPVVVLRHDENRGPAAAMNTGVRYAFDDAIIARLDVGDAFIPAKSKQLRHIRQHGIRASFSPHFDAVERCTFSPPPTWRTRIFKDGVFCLCTCVFDRSVWREVGGFDESLRYADDWDFTMRVQHAVGWTPFHEVTCKAGAFPDGHTHRAARDPQLAARQASDRARVHARGLQLSHPRPQPMRVH